MKQIETLIPDIYALFGTDETFDLSLFNEFGENLKGLMDARFHQKYDSTPRLRMSNIGKADRQLWYDLNGTNEKEALLPATLIKFAYGDVIEQMVLLYAKMAGHTVEDEQKGVELDGIKGSIDAIIDGVVVDVKSASTYSFQKFESGALFLPGNDPFGYVAQLCGYIKALGKERGGFLAVDKTLGKLCFCEIPSHVIQAYDVSSRIAHIKEVVSAPEPPPRCYSDVPDGASGNRKLATGCSYCSHKAHCWADSNNGKGLAVYYYSAGPRYLTEVKREPKVRFEDA